MHIDVTAQTFITAAAVLSAVIALIGFYNKCYKWYQKQEEQTKDIETLKRKHEDDMAKMQKENTLLCYGLSAALDCLMQLGANHTVPKAKEKLDKYLNNGAHDQL